ncbi:hypothetical protein ACFQT0_28640 [Hymenobacter humi]|uniref:Uncharacterized protein n=1 Tax=Hymenobacter humi TaxID=1411620 RepID=A0ABW2UBH0_9BACT
MMRKTLNLTSALILLVFSAFGQTQDRDYTPIPESEIERGLHDINYMRAVLLEKGFEIDSQEEKDGHLHEYWQIKGADSPFGVIVFQINASSPGQDKYAFFHYSVRKDLFPSYADNVKSDILLNLPLKRVQDAELTTTGAGQSGIPRKVYHLMYCKSGSPIEAEVNSEGKWASFDYSLPLSSPSSKSKATLAKKPVASGMKKRSVSASVRKSK